jgi:alcohol dehydrogenase (cytochrome c)
MKRSIRLIHTALLALTTFPIQPVATVAVAQPNDWITINKDYSSQRYVDLDRITPANIGNLKEICEVVLNEPNLFSSGLLKVGRTLYTSTGHASYAVDAANCELRWRRVVVFKQMPAAGNSRGLGYLGGKVFRGTIDGRVIAIDANTGRLLWDVQGADPAKGESFVSAPIAWNGKVFIGIAYSEAHIAGRLMAFDADSGKELWRFETTLGAPFGGGFWTTYSLDSATGEVLAPVGNPVPDFTRNAVANDSDYTKYTNSVIAVDAATGRLRWSYQVVPRDDHDWDLGPAPTLYHTSGGKEMVAVTGKSGRVYGIDRATQRLVFDTPATTIENDQVSFDGKWTYVCPGVQGGAMFNGAAYDPAIGTLYVGMSDHCAWFIDLPPAGAAVKDWMAAAKRQAPTGWITALDGQTGAVMWRYHAESQVLAGLVPTKSGLLFGGDTHGNLLVFDAATGALLKRLGTAGALNDGLISYLVDGEQYVAVTAGGPTENPSTVAGPLRVIIYGLHGNDQPKVVTLDRLGAGQVPLIPVDQASYGQACSQCHGPAAEGGSAPPLARQSQLADPELLKRFLATVPPPMPRLYPGMLNDNDVRMISLYLRRAVFKCGPDELQRCQPPVPPRTAGTKAWHAVYSVLTSPRCLNCHPVKSQLSDYMMSNSPDSVPYVQDYPRQGDDRHPHYYAVVRGDTIDLETAEKTGTVHPGIGPLFERCTSCHGTANDPKTGIPGASNAQIPGEPFWALAPAAMAWEAAPGVPMTGPQLCAQLKDKTRNGNRTLTDLLHHLETEPLVNWAWRPGVRPNGERRTTPPISHAAFIQAFQAWMNTGAPCPSE